jgi:chemotaxis signal transduction protein
MSRGRSIRGGFGLSGKIVERDKPRDEIVQLCGFRIGDEEYAVDIMRIKEIINPLPTDSKCPERRVH